MLLDSSTGQSCPVSSSLGQSPTPALTLHGVKLERGKPKRVMLPDAVAPCLVELVVDHVQLVLAHQGSLEVRQPGRLATQPTGLLHSVLGKGYPAALEQGKGMEAGWQHQHEEASYLDATHCG